MLTEVEKAPKRTKKDDQNMGELFLQVILNLSNLCFFILKKCILERSDKFMKV